MVKKIALVLLVTLFQSCIVFKKIETSYYLNDSVVVNEAVQSVSGSEVDGNTLKAKAALK